ncbi:MAG: hypothetical protein ABIH76_02020 [Candidatus Bathyarchaeota archaeon]
MAEKKVLTMEDLVRLLHTIILAYQQAIRGILGPSAAVFIHPVNSIVNQIQEKLDEQIIKGRNIDEVMKNYANLLMSSGYIKKATAEKLSPDGYLFKLEGCTCNKNGKTHMALGLTNAICPWAMIAQAIYSKFTGKKIKPAYTSYEKNLSVTEVTHQATASS